MTVTLFSASRGAHLSPERVKGLRERARRRGAITFKDCMYNGGAAEFPLPSWAFFHRFALIIDKGIASLSVSLVRSV